MILTPDFIRRRIANRPNLLKIVENISWLFLGRILHITVGLILTIWIARYLGPEQFGLLSFATALVGLSGALAGLGLKDIVVRDIVRNPAGKEETLGTAALLLFFGGLLAYGLILGTIFMLRPDDLLAKALVAILGSATLFKASDVAAYWFESQVLSKYSVWAQVGSFFIFAAIKGMLILNDAPLVAFAWATLAEASLVALMMSTFICLRESTLRRLRITIFRAKELLMDSWPLLLSSMTIMIYMKIDQIMLGQMVGDEAVGIYSTAVRISEAWYFVPMMIVISVFPAILETKRRSEAQYHQRMQDLYDLMVWLSIAVALPMSFLSTPIVTALFGEAFAASGHVLTIHIWAAVFVFLGFASSRWFLAENLQFLSFQRTAFGAVVNVLLNWLTIPHYGAIGAAIATVVSQAAAGWLFDALHPVTREMFGMKLKSMNLLRSSNQLRKIKIGSLSWKRRPKET